MSTKASSTTLLRAVVPLVFVWLMGSNSASATTYYVSTTGNDANPGSQTSPWRTIAKAANAMIAGDTVIVNPGTYSEKVATVRSGTSTNRITFRASGKVVTKTFTIGHNYITIDGFEMTAANQGYMMPVTGSYCEILNNVIHDTGATWGIIQLNSNNVGCLIKNNRYYSSTGPGDDLPVIILSGNNNIAESNEIGPAKDIDAFRVWGTGNIIRNNYIHDITMSPGSVAHMDVIQTFGGSSNNIVFERNIINNTNGNYFQIFMTEYSGSATTGNWDIRNNLYIGVNGQANFGIPNIRFCNNTLYNVGGSNKLVMYLYDAAGKSNYSGAQIKNNIFVPASNIDSYRQVMAVGSSGTNVQISSNLISRISTFTGVSGFADPNGINGGDPKFANASGYDFRLLSSSPAIGRAATLTGFNYDYDLTPRPQGSAWDIGAFEYKDGIGTTPLIAPTNLRVL